MDAVTHRVARPDGVLTGSGGGDSGLFAGILARYLVVAALRRPRANGRGRGGIVPASADAAWPQACRAAAVRCSPQWSRPAARPRRRRPERDLSVQLSGWMVMEAAAWLPQ